MKKIYLLIVIIIASFLVVYFLPKEIKTKSMAEFSLPVLNSSQILNNKTLEGKYSLVNFFASWCTSCIVEHDNLKQLNKHLNIYGIAWNDKPDKLNQWLQKHGNPYTAIGMDENGGTIIDFGVVGVPESFLISPKGEVIFHYPGPLTSDIIEKEILPRIENE